MAAFENLEFPNWSTKTKEHTLNARIYNGAISFTVWPNDRSQGGGKPLASISWDKGGQGFVGFQKVYSDLVKSPLGTKIPMSRTKYNPQTRQVSNIWMMTFEKDQEMCYWVTLTDCEKGGTPYRFPIMAPKSILIGSEPPTKSGQSDMGMQIFVNWLKKADHYAPTTANKPTFGKGGGQGPRPGATPAAAAVSPSVASDPESNMPF